jgi:hypothetical protein
MCIKSFCPSAHVFHLQNCSVDKIQTEFDNFFSRGSLYKNVIHNTNMDSLSNASFQYSIYLTKYKKKFLLVAPMLYKLAALYFYLE